jgi:hypothetical protein
MDDLYIGTTTRKTREFRNAGTLEDLTALTVDIRRESDGSYLTTTAEGTFHDLNILANRVSTGKYFARITPDAAEGLGVYLLTWTATYGTGPGAETFTAGPDVLIIHAEADIPALADNYLSLDALTKFYPKLFDLGIPPARILRIGWLISRDIDSMLDERFDVPIQKREGGIYDQPLIDAAAALTVARILTPNYPDEGSEWQDRGEKIVDGINGGRYRLDIEITKDEVGFSIPKPGASNTSVNVQLELDPDCAYSDIYRRKIILKIDSAGAIGVATVKISVDAGASWGETGKPTSEIWSYASIAFGLGFRFFRLAANENLALGDEWTINAVPMSTAPTVSKRAIRTAELQL